MLRSHLHYLPGCLYGGARGFRFTQNVSKRFFYIAVLPCPDHFRAEFGMLVIAGGDHHAIDSRVFEHLLGVLVNLGFGAK